ncbi:MAG: hypothetical protein JKX76_01170 [Colwellia sp.]|nr:hypothetical protein [Colwellia sp.]
MDYNFCTDYNQAIPSDIITNNNLFTTLKENEYDSSFLTRSIICLADDCYYTHQNLIEELIILQYTHGWDISHLFDKIEWVKLGEIIPSNIVMKLIELNQANIDRSIIHPTDLSLGNIEPHILEGIIQSIDFMKSRRGSSDAVYPLVQLFLAINEQKNNGGEINERVEGILENIGTAS